MSLTTKAPIAQLLEAAKQSLDAAVAANRLSIAGTPPYVRHYRFRPTTPEEAVDGCIALRFDRDVSRDDGGDGSSLSTSEAVRQMDCTLVLDYPPPLEDDDPSGFDIWPRLLTKAVNELRDEDSALSELAWWVELAALDPGEDNISDSARLEQSISVIYRTSSTDPTVLLPN